MAKTYPIQQLKVVYPHDMSAAAVYLPEAASQTFVAGAPVLWSSGYVATAAANPDTDTDVIGFALEDGHNDSVAGTSKVKVMPLIGEVYVEVNFLDSDGTDRTLAATELGNTCDLSLTTISGEAIWHADTAGAAKGALRIVSFKTTTLVPNSSEVEAVAGDTNARVLCVPRSAWNGWNS